MSVEWKLSQHTHMHTQYKYAIARRRHCVSQPVSLLQCVTPLAAVSEPACLLINIARSHISYVDEHV